MGNYLRILKLSGVSPPSALTVIRHLPTFVCIDFPGTWKIQLFKGRSWKPRLPWCTYRLLRGCFCSPVCFVWLHNF